MGKIANILNDSNLLPHKKRDKIAALDKNEKTDLKDLEAAVDSESLVDIQDVVSRLRNQNPKVKIEEKIITRKFGKFINPAREAPIISELLDAVIDSGQKVTHESLKKMLDVWTPFDKGQHLYMVLKAMNRSKTYTDDAVKYVIGNVVQNCIRQVPNIKENVFSWYLDSNNNGYTPGIDQLAKENKVDLKSMAKYKPEDRDKFAEFVKKKEAEKLAKPPAAAAKNPKKPESQEEKKGEKPDSPSPRTW